MMSVRQPYGQEIVCLCENVHTILRCHLTTIDEKKKEDDGSEFSNPNRNGFVYFFNVEFKLAINYFNLVGFFIYPP